MTSSRPYHHGNLRTELIEAGIDLLNSEGFKGFSLRKVAIKCSVSHTAPYSHFKDIDALIGAMSEYVTRQFMEELSHSITGEKDGQNAVLLMGQAYINFFQKNPQYFQFLYYHSGIHIHLDKEMPDDYPPFALFRATAYKMFDQKSFPKYLYPEILASLWSKVHGIVALLTNPNIHYSGDWQQVFKNMVESIQ